MNYAMACTRNPISGAASAAVLTQLEADSNSSSPASVTGELEYCAQSVLKTGPKTTNRGAVYRPRCNAQDSSKRPNHRNPLAFYGRGSGIRTRDLLLPKQAHYRKSAAIATA